MDCIETANVRISKRAEEFNSFSFERRISATLVKSST